MVSVHQPSATSSSSAVTKDLPENKYKQLQNDGNVATTKVPHSPEACAHVDGTISSHHTDAISGVTRFETRRSSSRYTSLNMDIRNFLNSWWQYTKTYRPEQQPSKHTTSQPTEADSSVWIWHILSGGTAGAVSRTLTAPLDRVKVYLQVQRGHTGILTGFKYMMREGGLLSFWRGNGMNVLKIAPESAIKFAAYERIKLQMRSDENQKMNIRQRFVAGAAAGSISQTIIYPMEVLKTRLVLRTTGQYAGILDAARKIYAHEGWRSFYRGYLPNMLGIVPYAGIDLAVYETLKRMYLHSRGHDDEHNDYNILVPMACGSISSSLGQLFSYPLSLLRTRLQAQTPAASASEEIRLSAGATKKAGDGTESNMLAVAKSIVEREGVRGLYRGMTATFLKVVPAVSISYLVYEYASRFMGIHMT